MKYYFIIFPYGDRTKLCVLETTEAMKYEINEWALASRKEFTDKDIAVAYAKELARKHNIEYVIDVDDDGYLD